MTLNLRKYEMNSMTGTTVLLDKKQYLYFAGTSYFQLHSHPKLIEASKKAIDIYGIGTATTRTLTGTTPLIKEIEKKLAIYFDTEDAVYVPSGYLSSLAGLKALDTLYDYDVIFIDENAHYSLLENALATAKKVISFKHLDAQDLRTKITQNCNEFQIPLIASDGLFPIAGIVAPINDYLKIAEEFNGFIFIDDAHGVGILGQNGRGTCEEIQIHSKRIFVGATLSKAFGAYGGFLYGSKLFINEVRKGSVITGSSSPMSAAVAAGIKGVELLGEKSNLREKLWKNSRFLKERLSSIGLSTNQNNIPIISFSYDNAKKMQTLQQELMNKGIYIQHTYYKGAGSDGLLRIVVSSEHTDKQIDILIESLREVIPNKH